MHRRERRQLGRWVVLGALTLAACVEQLDDGDGAGSDDPDAIEDAATNDADDERVPEVTEPAGALIAEVRYQTRWDRSPEGPWTTTNDLGYTITVERGYLVNYSAALVECLDARGHGESVNLTETPTPWMEPLAPARPGAFESRAFTAARYCHVHYLVARSDAETDGLPIDHEPALEGLSVWLEGHYLAPGASQGEELDFTISTSAPFGAIYELTPNIEFEAQTETPLDADAPLRATVALERQLDTLFDAVDFDDSDSDSDGHARQVVENVVSHARLSISLAPLDPDAPLPAAS